VCFSNFQLPASNTNTAGINSLPRNMSRSEIIIAQTKKWIVDVVVGCNFCPFAAREIKRGSIHYEVVSSDAIESSLSKLMVAFQQLDSDKAIETTLLIFPDSFADFTDYLHLVAAAEELVENEGYEGVYQVASFHPAYLFDGSDDRDPANYTNRSPYPMLHILREESLTEAIDNHPDTEVIPERNIEYARKKGLSHMQLLRELSMAIQS
jgi:hypothetical protein